MKKNTTTYRVLFAGGGTGGHLYPALAVADKVREMQPDSRILFMGTKHKIEGTVVPKYGYEFKSIWISGFARKLTLNNLLFPAKVLVSMIQSLFINMGLNPRVAVGSGGYVAGPALWAASVLGAKIVLIEPNSYPGVTNRLLEKKADEIHIAFEESKKYFREQSKLKMTGNPIRHNLRLGGKAEAKKYFGLDESGKTLLILGGSLGARSINNALDKHISNLTQQGIQVIWQTGKLYYDKLKHHESETVKVMPFIDDMAKAFSACDLLLARSGATTIAEAAYLGLPVIFVPSKNVAENHQYKNAKAIVDADAAELIEDDNLNDELVGKVTSMMNDEEKLNGLRNEIKKFSKPDAAKEIAESVIRLAGQL